LLSREVFLDFPVIEAAENSAMPLSFSGVDTTGAETPITAGVMCEVVPPGLGYVRNNIFYSAGSGTGHIKFTAGNVSTYAGLIVGGQDMNFHSFEGDAGSYEFSGYPDTVSGKVDLISWEKIDGNYAGRLEYFMPLSETTQAAYFNFDEPLEIPGEPVGLKLAVYGDNSNLWLRGRITDAEGDSFAITFAGEIDWDGWKYTYAKLPESCVYPISLESVYVAALSTVRDISGEIYIDTLKVVYPFENVNFSFPETPKFTDPLKVELSEHIAEGSYDLVFSGLAPVDKLETIFTSARASFILNGDDDDILSKFPDGKVVYGHNVSYGMFEAENTLIVRMTAKDGGLFRSDIYQWARFSNDFRASGKDHVIIMLDTDPFDFRQKKEFEMFADELTRIESESSAKNIFVISSDGFETTSVTRGKVRFINLGSYYHEEGYLNPDYGSVRFRVNGTDIRFEVS